MNKLTELYNDLSDRGVVLFSGCYHLSEGAEAATVKIGPHFGVFLDIDRVRTVQQEKVVIAHEWGHIVCDATYGMDAPPAVRQKAEHTATVAQIKELLPYEDLAGALKDGCTSVHELSEQLVLPEDFIQQAFDYYTGPCGLTFQEAI